MLDWLETATEENASVFHPRRDTLQPYIDRRIITIGMIPTAQLLDWARATRSVNRRWCGIW